MRFGRAAAMIMTLLAFILILLTVFLPADLTTPTMTTEKEALTQRVGYDEAMVNRKVDHAADLLRYFGVNSTFVDAGFITWAHAVNSKKEFDDSLAAGIHFFEADILLRRGGAGTEAAVGRLVPIMAHPPATDSDLTLAEFLEKSSSRQIGIKLDFKTDEAIRGSVDVLSQYQRKRIAMTTPNPLWMNADIVGHGVVTGGKVAANVFLDVTRRITPNATLSVGWNIAADYFHTSHTVESTSSSTTTSTPSLSTAYSEADVRRMRDALTLHGVDPASTRITFAVWSKFIPDSLETLKWLTDQFPQSSITIWGKSDDASIERVSKIYYVFERSKVFVDLPEEMRNQMIGVNRKSSDEK